MYNGYPRATQGIPKGYPRDTQGLPKGYLRDTQGIPKGYPRDTQGIPKGYPRDTQGIPKGYPRGQHRSNTGSIPDQHRSNALTVGSRCRAVVWGSPPARYRVRVNMVRHSHSECSTPKLGQPRSSGVNIIHCNHRAQASRRAKARSQATATLCRAWLHELSPRL